MKLIYSDLRPKERFTSILREFVYPEIEPMGFKFSKSKPALTRQVGDIKQEIGFYGSKWNHGNVVCIYRPYFQVRSKSYGKWLKNEFQIGSTYEFLYSSLGQVRKIEGWDEGKYGHHSYSDYDFAKYDNEELIQIIKKNIIHSGIPLMEKMSDYNNIIKDCMDNGLKGSAPRLLDFCYLLGNKEKAHEILKWSSDINFVNHVVENLNLRKLKFKNWL